MSRHSEKLYQGITDIRDDLIKQAEKLPHQKKDIHRKRILALAACAVIAVGIGKMISLQGEGVANPYGERATPAASAPVDDNASGGDFSNSTVPITSSNVMGYEDDAITSYRMAQDFGYELLQKNADETNPIISPASAYLALTMAGMGAEGETKKEIHNVLGSDMSSISERLIQHLSYENKTGKLIMANSIWTDTSFIVNEQWPEDVSRLFEAEIFSRNLNKRKTIKEINRWGKERTEGQISKILRSPLSKDDMFVILNAVYFKADWEQQFDKACTMKRTFTTAADKEISVEMMHNYHAHELYIKDETVEGVIRPYQDSNLVYVALMPTDGATVREMLHKLTGEQVSKLMESQQSTFMDLGLPKYDVISNKQLNESLKQMGIQKAFDSQTADFSGAGSAETGENLFISMIMQNTFISLDEEGTEAGAVTLEFGAGAAAFDEEPMRLYFDKPFLYMIMTEDTQVPIFIGIMDNPNK